jgi:hypothetical protein
MTKRKLSLFVNLATGILIERQVTTHHLTRPPTPLYTRPMQWVSQAVRETGVSRLTRPNAARTRHARVASGDRCRSATPVHVATAGRRLLRKGDARRSRGCHGRTGATDREVSVSRWTMIGSAPTWGNCRVYVSSPPTLNRRAKREHDSDRVCSPRPARRSAINLTLSRRRFGHAPPPPAPIESSRYPPPDDDTYSRPSAGRLAGGVYNTR